jgi:hypothetical protein
MTLEELKQRILETGYLPEWLKDNVDLMGQAGTKLVLPVTTPPQPEGKKWCPHARVNLGQTPGSNDSFNRMARALPEGGLEISTVGAFCIEGACQMWTGEDCGLKAFSPTMKSFFSGESAQLRVLMKKLVEEDTPDANTGDADPAGGTGDTDPAVDP